MHDPELSLSRSEFRSIPLLSRQVIFICDRDCLLVEKILRTAIILAVKADDYFYRFPSLLSL